MLAKILDISGSSEEDSLFGLTLEIGPEKRILEVLGVPHSVEDDNINIANNDGYALLKTLTKTLDIEDDSTTLEAINKVAPVKIMAKAPIYLGGRVGRPEKSKERKMKPAPHALFPIGTNGGSRRNIIDAAKKGNHKCRYCKVQMYRMWGRVNAGYLSCMWCKNHTNQFWKEKD